eukprot:scaffold25320_cov63-Cyclotella_meneghiniana.AAC.1
MLSESEINERAELGLITVDSHAEEEEEEEGEGGGIEEIEEEEWEEFDEEDANTSRDLGSSDEEYTFDEGRKSSVDPLMTKTSPPGSTHDNHDVNMDGNVEMNPKRIDFTGVDTSSRRGKRGGSAIAFASISETNEEEEEEEESTVGDEDMEPFEDAHCSVTVDGA